MRRRFHRGLWWVYVWMVFSTGLSAQSPGREDSKLWPEIRFKRGDDPAWAAPGYDDRAWQRISPNALPSNDGIYWLRFRVKIRRERRQRPDNSLDAVLIAMVASFDLYWDGRYIGSSGQPGAKPELETVGDLDTLLRIPEMSREGEHVVALRISSWNTGFPGTTYGINFRLVRMRDHLTYLARTAAWSVLAMGGAMVLGAVFLLMWGLTDRRPAMLWFSGMCFSAAVMQALQAWRGLYEYPYSWHYARSCAIAVSAGLVGLMLVGFLTSLFKVKRAWVWLAGVLLVMLLLWPRHPIYYVKALFLVWCAYTAATVIASSAAARKVRSARLMLPCLVLNILILLNDPGEFLEHSFVFSFGAAMVGGTIALTLQFRDDRRAARQAQLTAARLEIELLKKNIQPHFLMNTLTTIMEVIEQSPREAVGLIEALASEFRILARISSERLIPLAQELELCESHLRIMALRKGAQATLEVKGIDDRTFVPPALFHTLLENGFTHLPPRSKTDIVFKLSGERAGELTRYRFLAPGKPVPVRTTKNEIPSKQEGTGLRYVKARLEESFAGRWNFSAGPVADGWETVIELRGGAEP